MKWLKYKFHNWLNVHGWYRLNEVQLGGHCGCCGKIIKDKYFPLDWTWGQCEDCKKLLK